MKLGQHLNKLHLAASAWPVAIHPGVPRVATLHWYQIETSPGVYDWSKADAIFARIPAGIKAIVAHSGTPRFYSVRPDEPGNAVFPVGTLAEPADGTKQENFHRAFIARYFDKLGWLEGLNEPCGSGHSTASPAAVVESQRNVFRAAYNFRNDVKVISAPFIMNSEASWDYFKALIAQTHAFDVIGCHYYDESGDLADFHGMLWRLRDTIRKYADADNRVKPVAVTEFGKKDFTYLPAASQIALLQEYAAIMDRFNVSLAVHFAYDETASGYGFLGNAQTEAGWNALQQKYA